MFILSETVFSVEPCDFIGSWDDGMMNWTYKLIDSLLLELLIIYIHVEPN